MHQHFDHHNWDQLVNARTTATVGDHVQLLRRDLTVLGQGLAQLNRSFYDSQQVRSSCFAHYAAGAREDGTYLIGPDSDDQSQQSERVFCDMANGGWTLVAMVHTCSYLYDGNVNEPNDFFISGFGSESNLLQGNINVDCSEGIALPCCCILL